VASVNDRTSERGLALVSVLWAVSILSLIAASLLATSRLSYREERSSRTQAELRALAEAGVARAILGLIDRRPDHRWRVDGIPIGIAFEGARLVVRVEDEFGKIDLNMADAELLRGLFRTTAKAPDLADTLTDRILDWREADELRHARGASTEDYRGAGYEPRRGAFQSVDELMLVLGMTSGIFDRVRPALTVYSGRPAVDTRTAPAAALLALPGMDESKVGDILAERLRDGGAPGFKSRSGALDLTFSLIGRAVSIKVKAERGRSEANLEAVVRLTDDPGRPYWVLAWQ